MKIKVAIPTYGRADTILKDTLSIFEWAEDYFDITIFANPKGQKSEYEKVLKWKCKIVELEKTSWFSNIVNQILDYYDIWDEIMLLDDDIKRILTAKKIKWKTKTVVLTTSEFAEIIHKGFNSCKKLGFKYWGLQPSSNRMNFTNTISCTAYVRNTVSGIIVSDLRFDEDILDKCDYDFTLQNIFRFWWALRFNMFWYLSKYNTNKWWLNDDLKARELRQIDSIKKLKQKWPEIIKDHPKRKNEIIMRFKK